MAALDFPNTPTVGQVATLTNGCVYRWDGAVWTASVVGAPPTGPAGGDLAGTYPNPTVAPLAVGNAEISDVAYGKVTGAPTSLPPSGAASGDLSGSYPSPQLAAGAIVDADVSASAAIQYTKLTGVPTSLPPNGAASGDLTGTYPAPTIGALKVTDAKVNDVGATKLTGTIAQARFPVAPSGLLTANVNDAQITDAKIVGLAYAKLTGAPTALPPSGAAGGDLAGTYPTPTIGAGSANAFARVYRTTTQSIPSSTVTVVRFTTVATNQGGLWNAGSDDRLTIQTAGVYLLGTTAQFALGAAGRRLFMLQAAGTTLAVVEIYQGPSMFPGATVVAVASLSAGTVVQFSVFQDAGVAVDLTPTGQVPALWACRLV